MASYNKTILVLGARGLLGHTLYAYLKTHNKQNVIGTSHSPSKNLLACDEKNIISVISSIGPISYVINCIGALRTTTKQPKKILFSINASLPLTIASIAETHPFRLIHISTDGVYPPTSGPVDEKTPPSPIDIYGKSKLLGEPASCSALTIRTSIIGLDPIHHHGLLEWVLRNKEGAVQGYTNQIWSGCTSLQLAKYIQSIIAHDCFDNIRAQTPIMHYAPLGPTRKYDLIKKFIEIAKMKNIRLIPSKGPPIQRFLISRYTAILHDVESKTTIKNALSALMKFENQSL